MKQHVHSVPIGFSALSAFAGDPLLRGLPPVRSMRAFISLLATVAVLMVAFVVVVIVL